MRLLIHCTHYPVCSGRYAADAFKRLGHDVKTAGVSTGRNIWNMEVPSEYAFTPDYAPDAISDDFDLCVLMDTAYQWHHPTIPTVAWSVDNHVRDLRQDGIEMYFLAHRKVSVMDWQYSVPNYDLDVDGLYTDHQREDMTHLPCAYDPVHFTPSPIPYTERAYDVCMIGVMYPERWRLVNELRAAGLKVLAGTGLIYEAYRDAYHNSRISLCVSSNGDVAQRVFETAAMGCVVVSDKCPDFDILQPLGFWAIEPDMSIVEQVRLILASPNTAQEQITLSQAWAVPHTWDARAKVIVEWWEARNGTNR